MATSDIISQVSASGQLVNLRASALRYFTATTGVPGGGEVSLTITNDDGVFSINPGTINWTSYKQGGTMFMMEVPTNYDSSRKLQLFLNMNDGNGNVRLIIDSNNESMVISRGDVLFVYFETLSNRYHILDHVKVSNDGNSISSGSAIVPTGNAVYNYVTQLISNRWGYVICPATASKIPSGAVYTSTNTSITGTMAASASTEYKIYLVKHTHSNPSIGTNGSDYYDEWITVNTGTTSSPIYKWEKIGNTDINLDGIAGYITSNLSDHTLSVPSSGSVYIPSHNHTFSGASTTSTGKFTPQGTVLISNSPNNGSEYTPNGTVTSTFTGTTKRIKFVGTDTSATLNVSAHTTGDAGGTTCPITVNSSGGQHTHDGTLKIKTGASAIKATDGTQTGGSHSHIGTISQFTCSGTLSSTGSSSSYTVSGEVLTLTPNTQPSSTVNITISTKTFTTSSGGKHTHSVFLSTVTLGSIINSMALNISSQSLLVKLGTHSHNVPAHTASGTIVPNGTINSVSSGGTVITPSGTVTSTFGGEKAYFLFKGTEGNVSVIGTPSGTVKGTTIGTKTVSLANETINLEHTIS